MGLYNIESDFGQYALELMTDCESTNTWCNMLKQVRDVLALAYACPHFALRMGTENWVPSTIVVSLATCCIRVQQQPWRRGTRKKSQISLGVTRGPRHLRRPSHAAFSVLAPQLQDTKVFTSSHRCVRCMF